MTKIFCHRDADGYCAGAIALRANPGATLQSMQYNEDIDIDAIDEGEDVYILDFTLQKPGVFEEVLKKTTNVVWIDHHKSSIGKFDDLVEKYEFTKILDTDHAGCYLTWYYFHPAVPPLFSVLLIEDMDLWRFDYGDDTREFINGLDGHEKDPVKNPELWQKLLSRNTSDMLEIIDELQAEGRVIIKYNTNMYKQLITYQSFTREWEGYNCIILNRGMVNSDVFQSVWGDYDIYIVYVYTGKDYLVSLYSDYPNTGIDVSGLAKEHGGGGHPGAAGFTAHENPFEPHDCHCDCKNK